MAAAHAQLVLEVRRLERAEQAGARPLPQPQGSHGRMRTMRIVWCFYGECGGIRSPLCCRHSIDNTAATTQRRHSAFRRLHCRCVAFGRRKGTHRPSMLLRAKAWTYCGIFMSAASQSPTSVAEGGDVITRRFQSKRAQRYMRVQLFPSTIR